MIMMIQTATILPYLVIIKDRPKKNKQKTGDADKSTA